MIAACFAVALNMMPTGITPQLVQYIYEQADKNGIPLTIVESLAQHESGWHISAVHRNANGTVDMGLFQVNSRTWTWLIERYHETGWAFDPYDNARIALRYLGDLYAVFGNWTLAIQAYNAGASSVINDTVPISTVYYARNILREAKL